MRALFVNTLALLCLVQVSCVTRIDFGQPEPLVTEMTVRITPLWNSSARPGRVNALFYNPAGILAKEVQLPVEGGDVTLVKDTYRVILCNPDAQFVVFGQMDQLSNAMAQVMTLAKSGQAIESPGPLFSAALELPIGIVKAEQLMVLRTVGVTVRLKAQDASLADAASVVVRLRNVADGVKLSTGQAYQTQQSDFSTVALKSAGVSGRLYSFVGSTFGSCAQPGCNNTTGHEVYADIEVTDTAGSIKALSVDITQALKAAQESVTTVSIDITVERLVLQAAVTGWVTGTASGEIIE